MIQASDPTRPRYSAMRILPAILFATAVSACATTGWASDPDALVEAAVADTQPARLADATARELTHLARFEPETLDQVYPELRALAAALVGLESLSADEGTMLGLGTAGSQDLPPAPEFDDAQSVMHAVHLASYRREAMALRGWAELQALYPVLAGLDARLEHAHIPEQGDFLRLKAGPFDTGAAALEVCTAVRPTGQYCQTTDFSGRPFGGPEAAE